MKNILYAFVLLCATHTAAQQPFTRIYNQDTAYGSDLFYGLCPAIQNTTDGGHLLQYYSGQHMVDGSGYDLPLLIKTDSAFIPQWQIVGVSGLAFKDSSVFLATAGGATDTPACTPIKKIDLQGNTTWSKIICLDGSSNVSLGNAVWANHKIRMIGDVQPGYILYAPAFVDIDSMGNLIRADTLLGDTIAFEHLYADDSGNYYFITTGLYGGGDRKITKLRADNTIVWSYIVHAAFSYDIATLVTLPNGDVLIGSNVSLTNYTERMFLMKFSASGQLLWQKIANRGSRLTDIKLMNDGNLMIAAGGLPVPAFSVLNEDDILKTDTAAHVLWAGNVAPQRTLWPFIKGLSVPYEQSSNELYFTAVTVNPYAAIIFSTDSTGNGHCASLPVTFGFRDTALFTLQRSTIDFAPIPLTISDYLWNLPVAPQPYVDSCDYALPSGVAQTTLPEDVALYPNPAGNTVYIKSAANIDRIAIYDMAGRSLLLQEVNARTCVVDITDLVNGCYIIKLSAGDGSSIYRKVAVVH